MGWIMRAALGWLVLVVFAGCAGSTATGASPVASPTVAREDCERSGGIWRAERAYCERPGAGGGGGGY